MAKPNLKPGIYENVKGKLFAYKGDGSDVHPYFNVHVHLPDGSDDWWCEQGNEIASARRVDSDEVKERIERLSQGRQTEKVSQLLKFLKQPFTQSFMKHLFIARHGNCIEYPDYSLSESGREQADELGKRIKEISGDSSVYIVASLARRAKQTAEIIAGNLDYPLEDIENLLYLWDGADVTSSGLPHEDQQGTFYLNPSREKALQIIKDRREKADSLIVVCHRDPVGILAQEVLEKELGKKIEGGGDFMNVSYGRAIHFDLEQKTYQEIP